MSHIAEAGKIVPFDLDDLTDFGTQQALGSAESKKTTKIGAPVVVGGGLGPRGRPWVIRALFDVCSAVLV